MQANLQFSEAANTFLRYATQSVGFSMKSVFFVSSPIDFRLQKFINGLALAEAKNPCDIDVVHKYKWETMTFNVFEMGTEEVVYNAFQVLSDGGVIIEPIGELPWSKCCATIIDKYGVCWWISI